MPSPPPALMDGSAEAGPEDSASTDGSVLASATALAPTATVPDGVDPSDTGAGPDGRKNRYHSPRPAAASTTTAAITRSGRRGERVTGGVVIAGSSGAPAGDGRGGGGRLETTDVDSIVDG